MARIDVARADVGLAVHAIEAMIAFVREAAFPWRGSGKKAADDPLTMRDIADLKVKLHAAEAVLANAIRAVDAAEGETSAAIIAAQAQVLAGEIASQAAGKLRDLSGLEPSGPPFDRSKEPLRWTVFAIGDQVVNGRVPPEYSGS